MKLYSPLVHKTLTICFTISFLHSTALAKDPYTLSTLQATQTSTEKPTPLPHTPNASLHLTAEVTGIEGEALDNVAARLKINLRPINEKATLRDIQHFYHNSPPEIEEALKPFGFFHPRITKNLTHEGKRWTAIFNVAPGDAMKISQVHIQFIGEGADDPAFEALKQKLLTKIGTTLNTKKYEDAKEDILELAERRGYFEAKMLENQLLIDLPRYTARIHILFDTGPRYHFGPVSFSPSPLSDRFLHRFVRFKPGEPYTEEKVQQLQQHLTQSNYFQKVSAEHTVASDREVPIDVSLQPKKSRQYIFGGGWGSDTRARALIGVNFRRLNPQGHQFKAAATVSSINKNVRTTYIIPGKDPVVDQYRIIGNLEALDENPGKSHNQRAGVEYSTRYHGWQPTVGLDFLNEKFMLYANPNIALSGDPLEQRAQMMVPHFLLTKANTNDSLQPTKGYQLDITLRGGKGRIKQVDDPFLLSDNELAYRKNNFLQTRVDLKTLYSLSPSQRILLRGAAAKTHIHDIFNLPLSLQYYAGGPQSVRGYGFLDIGPGKYFLFGSAEFQQKIVGQLYLTGFFDAASVNNHFGRYVKRSPGIGLVYLSQLGDIGIAIATPLNKLGPFELDIPVRASLRNQLDSTHWRKTRSFRIQFSIGSELFGIPSTD